MRAGDAAGTASMARVPATGRGSRGPAGPGRPAARNPQRTAGAGFADRARRNGMVPNGGVAVFFAPGRRTCTSSSSGADHWRPGRTTAGVRDHRSGRHGRASAADHIAAADLRPRQRAAGEPRQERDVRVVLYLNQVEANFRMLRFAAPVHIQLGHGESDKGSSISNQHKAYDLTFVGGAAGRDRLGAALRDFDAEHAPCRSAGRNSIMTTRARRSGRVGRLRVCTPRPGRATGRASRTARWPATGWPWSKP